MNGPQRAVLWLGLIMITFNLVRKWSEIKGVIFSGAASSASGGGTSATVPGGGITVNPPGGGVTIPFGGFPITIPLSNTTPATGSTKLVSYDYQY